MHARMFTFEGSPEELDEAARVAREQILPLEREMAGFLGLILLTDKEARKLVSLTLWESEELMRGSDESARLIARLAAQTVGGKRRSVEPFDVAVFEVSAPST
jgi:heme-degrading monooxygenase HmoA